MNDQEIWGRFKQSDKQALYLLYEKFYHTLLFTGLKISSRSDVVKDCIHQTFLYLWEKRAGVASEVQVKSYIITAFKRKLLAVLGEERKNNRQLQEWLQQEDDLLPEPPDMQLHAALQQRILRAVQQLSPRQQELVMLRFYEGKSYDEMVEMTGLTHRTVYNHLHEALKHLKEKLGPDMRAGNLSFSHLLFMLSLL